MHRLKKCIGSANSESDNLITLQIPFHSNCFLALHFKKVSCFLPWTLWDSLHQLHFPYTFTTYQSLLGAFVSFSYIWVTLLSPTSFTNPGSFYLSYLYLPFSFTIAAFVLHLTSSLLNFGYFHFICTGSLNIIRLYFGTTWEMFK